MKIVVTGATGFLGRHLVPALERAGHQVVSATRRPPAPGGQPETGCARWVEFDLERPHTVQAALAGADAAYYLVHHMDGRPGYAAREADSARLFAREAEAAAVKRIIYLGGMRPRRGTPSAHLESRLHTGVLLRQGRVPVFELRAGMIVGAGSQSWQIVRDLSARLPFMVLPRWLQAKSAPAALSDVLDALAHAAGLPVACAGVYGLPGPAALSGTEMLRQTSRLLGLAPVMLKVPFLSPKLSSLWLRLVTRADVSVARELVRGVAGDLEAGAPDFWSQMPGVFSPKPFRTAAAEALAADPRPFGTTGDLWEAMTLRLVGRSARAPA
ncbi:MAG: NAD(P)H-binding protein [Myxococcales bacterium]|nr:NAD(P)H-binding protein [Myxococcales bacterium]